MKDAAEYLLEAGVTLVGIDSLNIDDTEDLTRPVHSLLLAAEIPIVEHGLKSLAEKLDGIIERDDRGLRMEIVA